MSTNSNPPGDDVRSPSRRAETECAQHEEGTITYTENAIQTTYRSIVGQIAGGGERGVREFILTFQSGLRWLFARQIGGAAANGVVQDVLLDTITAIRAGQIEHPECLAHSYTRLGTVGCTTMSVRTPLGSVAVWAQPCRGERTGARAGSCVGQGASEDESEGS